MAELRVMGRVTEQSTGQGIPGLLVEAWDKDRSGDDNLGRATTDERGAFAIRFDERAFKDSPLEQGPQLFFRVLRGDKNVSIKEERISQQAEPGQFRAEIRVSLPAERQHRLEPIHIDAFRELLAREREIVARINEFPNGGGLWAIHPLMLLADVDVVLSDQVTKELLAREPRLRALSAVPYRALKNSTVKQAIRYRVRGLFEREEK
jgi:hypothetical protein